jgi:hypothetical protein
VVAIPWQEALTRAQQSEFIDAKTILGILMAQGTFVKREL